MLTFLAVVHIIVAVFLIFLVLIQDSKGGMGALGGGGGGSSSLLGATGAENILAKMTRWVAVIFGVSCVLLTIYSTRSSDSVVDGFVPKAAAPTETAAPAAGTEAPAKTEPAPADSNQP